jgi:hypothetical protein
MRLRGSVSFKTNSVPLKLVLFLQLFDCPFLCTLVVVRGTKNFEVTFFRPWHTLATSNLPSGLLLMNRFVGSPREVHRERKN